MTPNGSEAKESHVLQTTVDNWDEIIKESYVQPIVVKFWAPWCRVCKKNPKLYKQLSSKYTEEKIKFVECQSDNTILKLYGIKALPAVRAFKDGELFPEIGARGSRLLDFD